MQMDMCTCEVALGGDVRNVVVRGADRPVSFPETFLLAHLHGRSAITNVASLGRVDATPAGEKTRLVQKYGDKKVEPVFPGHSPSLPMLMAEYSPPSPVSSDIIETPMPEVAATEADEMFAGDNAGDTGKASGKGKGKG